MRFTGQVRVPEVDHPGVPAIFLVEDGQAEVLLEGESLGRWSLFDVHASRLVSAAFSVSLDGEEITFIADEPVDFAYKGVDHMAEVWAKYKAMTLPRRMVAVGKSRRGTTPSRISELREAMLANLAVFEEEESRLEAGAGADTPAIVTAVASPPPAPREPELVEPESLPSELAVPEVEPDPDPPVIEQPAVVETQVPRAALRPGPGLVAKAPTPAPLDPVEAFRPEPVPEEPIAVSEVFEPEPALVDPSPMPEIPEPEPLAEEPEQTIAAAEPEPVTETPEPAFEPEPEPVAEATQDTDDDSISGLVRELLEVSKEQNPPEAPAALLVDLTPAPPREPALAAAAPGDKAGLFGAVRAAFVRNKGSHEHQFVEAPGGIGIIRHICNECGYISIGVSETYEE